eukprot:m.58508 g.58508  ORF g.58508 m.58508 type:complete len:452 (-) comp6907_c0_seq1:17-1372(-)
MRVVDVVECRAELRADDDHMRQREHAEVRHVDWHDRSTQLLQACDCGPESSAHIGGRVVRPDPRHAHAQTGQGRVRDRRDVRRRLKGAGRHAGIRAGDGQVGQGEVADAACKGPGVGDGPGRARDLGDARERRLEPVDAAQPGGHADRAAAVRADGDGDNACRDCRGRPRRGAAGLDRKVVWVARRVVVGIDARGPHAELVHVRAAQDQRPSTAQACSKDAIALAGLIAKHNRAFGITVPDDVKLLLDGDGHPIQRPEGRAGLVPRGRGVRLGQEVGCVRVHDRRQRARVAVAHGMQDALGHLTGSCSTTLVGLDEVLGSPAAKRARRLGGQADGLGSQSGVLGNGLAGRDCDGVEGGLLGILGDKATDVVCAVHVQKVGAQRRPDQRQPQQPDTPLESGACYTRADRGLQVVCIVGGRLWERRLAHELHKHAEHQGDCKDDCCGRLEHPR